MSISGLTVLAGGRLLLRNASARFREGEVTLVVGPSGAGKSVLLRLIAGLLGPEDPDFDIDGRIEPTGAAATNRVGIVFQGFALFDELGASGNVLFALDHRTHSPGTRDTSEPPRRQAAHALLDDLDVPDDVPVALLSGGQKQRLAIARTLAHDPEVIVFDEPTTGLDPVNAARVVDRIESTRDRFGKTIVVVTHDHARLAPIADRIFFLDPVRHDLVEVGADELAGLWRTDDAAAKPATETRKARAREGVPARVARRVASFFAGTTRALEGTILSLALLFPIWRSARWGLRYVAHYVGLVASPSAFAYFGVAGVIAGFVSTHFTFKFLPFKAYTEPLITEELLHGLGFSLYRIVVPVLLTVLIAARSGAAVAADVGGRRFSQQIDAMRSLGAPPAPYLLTGINLAFVLATPVLIAFGFAVSRLTSLAVFTYNYPEHSSLFWDVHFHRNLQTPDTALYIGTGWLLAKVLACGFGTGAIAFHVGLSPKRTGVDVSRGITLTIIWATLWVLVIHFAFAFVEF